MKVSRAKLPSPAARDLISVLSFRASMGQCELRPEPRRCVGLWVPVMYKSDGPQRLRGFRLSTVEDLVAKGLVTLGDPDFQGRRTVSLGGSR